MVGCWDGVGGAGMSRWLGAGPQLEEPVCQCCVEAVTAPAGPGARLRTMALLLVALGSTLAAFFLHKKNTNLKRRLDCIKEDWRLLKRERQELKAELCRLKRTRSSTEVEVARAAHITRQMCDKVQLLSESGRQAHGQITQMQREIDALQEELSQSYRERDALKAQLASIMRHYAS